MLGSHYMMALTGTRNASWLCNMRRLSAHSSWFVPRTYCAYVEVPRPPLTSKSHKC